MRSFFAPFFFVPNERTSVTVTEDERPQGTATEAATRTENSCSDHCPFLPSSCPVWYANLVHFIERNSSLIVFFVNYWYYWFIVVLKGVANSIPNTANANNTMPPWAWIGGSNEVDKLPSYGTMGVASPLNYPGARILSTMATDRKGNLFLFGGVNTDNCQ